MCHFMNIMKSFIMEDSPPFLVSPGGSVVKKNPPTSVGYVDLIPALGRSHNEGNGNALHYSCLGNLIDRGAWQATVHGLAKELDMTEGLNHNYHHSYTSQCSFISLSFNRFSKSLS